MIQTKIAENVGRLRSFDATHSDEGLRANLDTIEEIRGIGSDFRRNGQNKDRKEV